MFNKVFRPINRRVRWIVGLVLVGLFCIQCAAPDGGAVVSDTVAIALSSNLQHASAAEFRQLAQKGHIQALQHCLENFRSKYRDYSCTFVKQERIGGKLTKEQEIDVKFRACPFSVMMAWKKNPPQGDRVLYIEGMYGDNMLVRPANALARAIAPTVKRKPDSPDARRSALKTVDEFGFEKSLENLLQVYRLADQRAELREELGDDTQVHGRPAFTLIRHLPKQDDYPAARTITYIDQEYLVPIMVEGFGWNNEFICRYVFKDLDFKVMADEEFSPEANGLVTPR